MNRDQVCISFTVNRQMENFFRRNLFCVLLFGLKLPSEWEKKEDILLPLPSQADGSNDIFINSHFLVRHWQCNLKNLNKFNRQFQSAFHLNGNSSVLLFASRFFFCCRRPIGLSFLFFPLARCDDSVFVCIAFNSRRPSNRTKSKQNEKTN